jgi:hypothetical protein
MQLRLYYNTPINDNHSQSEGKYIFRRVIMRSNHVRCTECRYAVIDKKASVYTRKRCRQCDNRKGCKIKKTDSICEKQTIKWAAIQCDCTYSEYHMALLKITSNGDRLKGIAWQGCESGVLAERRGIVWRFG